MNVYFLVEGKMTEPKVYPAWLSYLAPNLHKVKFCYQITENCYCLFSGEGFPNLLDNHLSNTIKDVEQHGNIDYLVLCLDADDRTVDETRKKVFNYLEAEKIEIPRNTEFVIICQNKCFETWFLGNKTFFKRNPTNQKLREYIGHYNVCEDDPEEMEKLPDFKGSSSTFHYEYFRCLCQEKRDKGATCHYSKTNPKLVTDKTFLDQLIARYEDINHIASFGEFLEFCRRINR
jgi:hypothetical protein